MKSIKNAWSEFEKAKSKDWSQGLSLEDLLSRINRVVKKMTSSQERQDSRMNSEILERTFRYYMTKGCVDPSHRVGRKSTYGFRHFLQTLVVRRLLAEGVPFRQIASRMSGRDNEALEQMLTAEEQLEARTSASAYHDLLRDSAEREPTGRWSRIQILSGLELHINDSIPAMNPKELRKIAGLLRKALEGAAKR